MPVKNIKVGDVIWIDKIGQQIEVLGPGYKLGSVNYWSDRYPEEVGTVKCRVMATWIVAELGVRVGRVGKRGRFSKELERKLR